MSKLLYQITSICFMLPVSVAILLWNNWTFSIRLLSLAKIHSLCSSNIWWNDEWRKMFANNWIIKRTAELGLRSDKKWLSSARSVSRISFTTIIVAPAASGLHICHRSRSRTGNTWSFGHVNNTGLMQLFHKFSNDSSLFLLLCVCTKSSLNTAICSFAMKYEVCVRFPSLVWEELNSDNLLINFAGSICARNPTTLVTGMCLPCFIFWLSPTKQNFWPLIRWNCLALGDIQRKTGGRTIRKPTGGCLEVRFLKNLFLSK